MKNSLERSDRDLNSFGWLEISDSVAASVGGSAFVGVTADASTTGNSNLAWTDTITSVRPLFGSGSTIGFSGGTIAIGKGKAIAIGTNPATNVGVVGGGDVVVDFTQNFTTPYQSISTGLIVAIDLPTSTLLNRTI